MCLCYISLIAAVTAAVPVNGSSSVPFIRRIQGCQPAETSSGDIHSVPARRTCQAPAAFYLPCFQVMCCYIFFLSTGTSAPPAGSSAFVFDPVKDRQPAEYTAGQVSCLSLSASADNCPSGGCGGSEQKHDRHCTVCSITGLNCLNLFEWGAAVNIHKFSHVCIFPG